MSDERERTYYPILGNGESYQEPIHKRFGGGEPKPPRTYSEARDLLKEQINLLRARIQNIPERLFLPNGVITCIRQHPRFLAKSYYPASLFRISAMSEVGSRRWYPSTFGKSEFGDTEFGRVIFALTNDRGLSEFEKTLDRPESIVSDEWKKDISRLEGIDLMIPEERIRGFRPDWQAGRVELVIHALEDDDMIAQAIERLKSLTNLDNSSLKIRPYPDGPTFISTSLDRATLDVLREFNPLRAVRPLPSVVIPKLRSQPIVDGPNPPPGGVRSEIVMGIFDGAVDERCPLVRDFVITHNDEIEIPIENDPESSSHGTAVAAAALYGPLNRYGRGDQLPTPVVTVECFRVIHDGTREADLYDVIDQIEETVNQRKDIKVFNLSFGPPGAIIDDDISRFTLVIDTLAHPDRALFTIACGNDGDLDIPELCRIQAPSDAVNALGVGAFSYNDKNEMVRAPYSSIGSGREGCKVKPDVVAFGGCDQRPIHIASIDGNKIMARGTSFASPIVAARGAELMGRCNRITPLVARALLIHTATHPNGTRDFELGNGAIKESVDEILSCSETEVTILFQSSLLPKRFTRLPIPLPDNGQAQGLVAISWTIALTTPVSSRDAEDYTYMGIEDTFHPHSRRYNFYPPEGGAPRTLDVDTDSHTVKSLLEAGWRQGSVPVSDSPRDEYMPESLRREGLKWDTVVRKKVRKRFTSLHEPCLILHAMDRGYRRQTTNKVEYAVVATISIPSYAGDLYSDIMHRYNRLQPLHIRSRNEIQVRIR